MARRQKRVKLSRAQKLEKETNRWLAKKDGAIATLCKAMEKLRELDRSRARMEKRKPDPVVYDEKGVAIGIRGERGPSAPEHPRVEAEAVADALVEDTPVPAKPKRRRKPNGDAAHGPLKTETLDAIADDMIAQRADRMKAMGFRQTSKRANKPAG